MLVETATREMTVFGAVGAVGVGISMVMLMFMFVGMAVNQLTVPVGMIMKVFMLMTVFMPVLQFEDLTRTVAFVAERQQIERLQILIGQKFGG